MTPVVHRSNAPDPSPDRSARFVLRCARDTRLGLLSSYASSHTEPPLLDRPSSSQRDRLDMYNANALKLGLFGVNCSSGRSATKVPERWSASWADCLALARMADEAGIDFMLPIGRWKGYGGDTDLHGETLETITWATGLLAATSRITVFGTVHAPLFHPIIAAKQIVTADHVGAGPLRPQHRRRLERGRVRDVRRPAARARGALRLRAGMDRRHQDGLGTARTTSISTASTSS